MGARRWLLSAIAAATVVVASPGRAQSEDLRVLPLGCIYGAIVGGIGSYAFVNTVVAAMIGSPATPIVVAATVVGGLAGCTLTVGYLNSPQPPAMVIR